MRPVLDPIVSHVTRIMTELTALKRTTGLILAVSGGLDSLVLLHTMAMTHDQWPFRLHVATFDHGWRAESAMDAVFVHEMAVQLGFDCTIGRMIIPDKTPLGREAAARTARYDFLAQVALAQGADAIVTAHHADDQIETILLHLLRGTGTHGLQGMMPYTRLPGYDTLWLMRPLLEISRDELAAYAQRHHLTPRHDVSNDDPRYQRNALRQEIVPQLKRFNPKFTQNLIRLSSIVRDEQSFLDQELQRGLLHYAEKSPERWMIERNRFWQEHIALQKRYVWQAAQTLSKTPQDVSHERIMAAVTMIREKRVGAKIEIPGDVLVHLTQTHVVMEWRHASPLAWPGPLLQEGQMISVAVPGITPVTERWTLVVNRVDEGLFEEMGMIRESDPSSQLVRLPEDMPVVLCTIQSKDKIGNKARQSILKTMKNSHIPTEFRTQLPLLIVGDEITAVFDGEGWIPLGKHVAWNIEYQKENGLLYSFMYVT